MSLIYITIYIYVYIQIINKNNLYLSAIKARYTQIIRYTGGLNIN